MPGRDAGNLTGAGPGDPGALRTLGSSHVNMAMQALGRGRDGTALDLARRGTERYRELFDRFPRHSDNDIAGLFFSLANALDEAGLTIEAQTLLAEMPARARARYAEAPDIAAPGLVEVLEAQYQDALTTGRHDPAADYAAELRDPAKRHAGQPFSMAVTAAALALAACADTLFPDGDAEVALPLYAARCRHRSRWCGPGDCIFLAARGAAYVEPPAVALTETAEVMEAYHALAPAFDRDRIALHGHALAAAGQGGPARAAWAEARELLEDDVEERSARATDRLLRKECRTDNT